MRRSVLAATLAAVALTLPAHAAPTSKPQITDASGDAVGMQAGTDITSVLWTTSGVTETTKVRGK